MSQSKLEDNTVILSAMSNQVYHEWMWAEFKVDLLLLISVLLVFPCFWLTVGEAVISSFSSFSTLLCRVTVSRAQPLFALVTSCLIAVRNPANIPHERRHQHKSYINSILADGNRRSSLKQILPQTNSTCLNQSEFIFWDSFIFSESSKLQFLQH